MCTIKNGIWPCRPPARRAWAWRGVACGLGVLAAVLCGTPAHAAPHGWWAFKVAVKAVQNGNENIPFGRFVDVTAVLNKQKARLPQVPCHSCASPSRAYMGLINNDCPAVAVLTTRKTANGAEAPYTLALMGEEGHFVYTTALVSRTTPANAMAQARKLAASSPLPDVCSR